MLIRAQNHQDYVDGHDMSWGGVTDERHPEPISNSGGSIIRLSGRLGGSAGVFSVSANHLAINPRAAWRREAGALQR